MAIYLLSFGLLSKNKIYGQATHSTKTSFQVIHGREEEKREIIGKRITERFVFLATFITTENFGDSFNLWFS